MDSRISLAESISPSQWPAQTERSPHSSDTMRTSRTRSLSPPRSQGVTSCFFSFLRWSAIQDSAFTDATGQEKVWSEHNVSEDFDMAMRLQEKGYIIRWSTYSGGEFKEGVSLTVDDELNRWQKYSYGCSELLFNPFAKWLTKGPINASIHRFFWCSAPLHYKLAILAYMFSYCKFSLPLVLSFLLIIHRISQTVSLPRLRLVS